MPEAEHYDLIVIGSGPAGENGAVTAAAAGKRVAVVEKSRWVGGVSANTGTLPSKTLRETALAISGLRTRDLYGVDLSIRREATIADLMHHEQHVKANARARIARNMAKEWIDLVRGSARFLDPHTVSVAEPAEGGTEVAGGERRLTADYFLIATGSSPVRPPGFPFEDHRVHDSDQILMLDRMPRSLAVVGAGVIGSEYACTFAALGAKAWIIDGRNELLPFLDADVSAALEASMRERLGIAFYWGEKVVRCQAPADPGAPVELETDAGRVLEADGVLVAAGRRSNTEALDLPAAGVTPGPKGLVKVDKFYRTEVPHIYAAGDVIGFPALAATSMEQARVAVCAAFGLCYKTGIAPLLPTGVYTIPEVSMVGASEEDLRAEGVDIVVGRARYDRNARGEIIGDHFGFLKLIFRRDDMKLLGVHVIGEQASELVHTGMMVMLADAGVELLDLACFNYPTLGDLYKDATYDALAQKAHIKLP